MNGPLLTLGERLVMAETLELCRALPRRAELVVINGVHRPPALPDAAEVVRAFATGS